MKSFHGHRPTASSTSPSRTSVENPLINGIEIINTDVPAPPPPTDTLTTVGFDGTCRDRPDAGPRHQHPLEPDARCVHGGQPALLRIFRQEPLPHHPERLDVRDARPGRPVPRPAWDNVDSHDGTTFNGNSPQLYSQMSQVTGMFYNAGRLFFTLSGDPGLHWAVVLTRQRHRRRRRVLGAVQRETSARPTACSSPATRCTTSRRTTRASTRSRSTGPACPAPRTLINGPSTGGIDWTNRSLFFAASPPANKAPTAAFTSSCAGWRLLVGRFDVHRQRRIRGRLHVGLR